MNQFFTYKDVRLSKFNPKLLLVWIFVIMCLPSNIALSAEQDWSYWAKHDENSILVIDHSTWDRILKTYVSSDSEGQNLFNYSAVSPADQRALKYYIETLASYEVSTLNRNEQLAYWINLYNALVISIVLDSYPVNSILDIGGDLFSRGPWKTDVVKVEGRALNIHEMMHKVISAQWNDMKIIYTLSCGAIGCPNIGSKAVQGRYVNGYIEAATFAFINSPKSVLGINESNIKLSRIFYWNKANYKLSHQEILQHIKYYATGKLAQKLKSVWHIGGYNFDWRLNDRCPQ